SFGMTPAASESTTARATALCAGPNICTACFAPLMVTLLKSSVSGLAGRFGATTASRVVKPSLLFVSALQKALPAGPDFDPMIRSTCATSLPSPTSDSPRKKSAAIENSSEKVVSKMLWRAGGAWLAGEWHAKRSRLSAGVYHESRGGQRT